MPIGLIYEPQVWLTKLITAVFWRRSLLSLVGKPERHRLEFLTVEIIFCSDIVLLLSAALINLRTHVCNIQYSFACYNSKKQSPMPGLPDSDLTPLFPLHGNGHSPKQTLRSRAHSSLGPHSGLLGRKLASFGICHPETFVAVEFHESCFDRASPASRSYRRFVEHLGSKICNAH